MAKPRLTARSLLTLFAAHRTDLRRLGRAAGSALRVHEAMQRHPILSIQKAADLTGLSEPTVSSALGRMEGLGIVRETTGQQRNRRYSHTPYVAILAEGTEPLD